VVRAVVVVVVFVFVFGCAPKLDDRLFHVVAPRVIAVRAEPAEAPAGATVTYTALQVSADGEITDAIDWAFCIERAPLASLGSVSVNCTLAQSDALVPFASGAIQAMGAIPVEACRIFGPDVPATMMGQPPGRPVDPDPTGGYYQPVRLLATDDLAATIERTRLSCGLASGTGEDRSDFMRRYHANRNPAPSAIDLALPAGTTTIDASQPTPAPIAVSAGARVAITVHWTECSSAVDQLGADGCSGAEPYLAYDDARASLVERREAIRVGWYATNGTLDQDQTGVAASDPTTSTDDAWVAPDVAGPASLWFVVRDDRGGVGWFRIDLVVTT